jgi:hypothetical protein
MTVSWIGSQLSSSHMPSPSGESASMSAGRFSGMFHLGALALDVLIVSDPIIRLVFLIVRMGALSHGSDFFVGRPAGSLPSTCFVTLAGTISLRLSFARSSCCSRRAAQSYDQLAFHPPWERPIKTYREMLALAQHSFLRVNLGPDVKCCPAESHG